MKLCCHMVDSDSRLFYQLTAIHKWGYERAREAINAYCEFLSLKMFKIDDEPEEILSPTDVIDVVWHAHILDTKAYQTFNTKYLGDQRSAYGDGSNGSSRTM